MTKKYDSFCSVCGFAITRNQIGAIIGGDIVDFHQRCLVDVSIHVCSECWHKITDVIDGGLNNAIKRTESLNKKDKVVMRRE